MTGRQKVRVDIPAVMAALAAAGLWVFITTFFLGRKPGTLSQNYLYAGIIPAALCLLFSFKDTTAALRHNRLIMATGVVLAVLVLPVCWSPALDRQLLQYALRRAATLASLFVICCVTARRFPKALRYLPEYIVVLAAAVAIVAVYHYHQRHGLFSGVRFSPHKGSIVSLGIYNNPIRIGWIWGATSLMTIWLAGHKVRRAGKWAWQVGYALLLLPQLGLLFVSYSRGAILAFCIATPLTLLARHWRKRSFWAIVAALVVLAATAFGGWRLAQHYHPDETRRISKEMMRSFQGGNYSYRIAMWKTVIKETGDNILFGQGLIPNQEFTIPSGQTFKHSHNLFMDIYRYSGIFGVCVLLAYLAALLHGSFIGDQPHPWGPMLVYGIVCLLTNGKYPLTNVSEYWFIFWVPIACVTALRARQPRKA